MSDWDTTQLYEHGEVHVMCLSALIKTIKFPEILSIDDIIWAATWQNQQNECAPSLIRVFTVRLKEAMVLSYPLSAQ